MADLVTPGTDPADLAGALSRLSGRVAQAPAPTPRAEALLDEAVRALGAVAGVLLVGAHHLTVQARAGHPTAFPALSPHGTLNPQSLAAQALRRREPVYLEQAAARGVAPLGEDVQPAEALGASAAVPLLAGDQPVGVLVLEFTPPRVFPAEQRQFLHTLGHLGALALVRHPGLGGPQTTGPDRGHDVRPNPLLDEERAALAAAAHFTEASREITDELALMQVAHDVLRSVLGDAPMASYERIGERWVAQVLTGTVAPQFVRAARAGVPGDLPAFVQPFLEGRPVFFDIWDADREGAQDTEMYRAGAMYPYTGSHESWDRNSR